jgi:endonuclease YncB( thermonuclease family)
MLLLAAAALVVACGNDSQAPPTAPSAAARALTPSALVQSVTDGDTIRLNQPVLGSSSVRMLNIDAPELNGNTQEPWAADARRSLSELLPAGTGVTLETDRMTLDAFGRLLAHVLRSDDGVNANAEQVRRGHALLYAIWPNVSRYDDYRLAQIEAERQRRGIWASERPLLELPFEYRRRTGGDRPSRPAGDFLTKYFVPPADYARVSVHNRVFFASANEAQSAGYRVCPFEGGEYASYCF